MEIRIEQRHIDQGLQGSVNGCAIARAIREQFGASEVFVSIGGAAIDGQTYRVAPEFTQFVRDFDHDKGSVQPTTVTLSPYFPDSRRMPDLMPLKSVSTGTISLNNVKSLYQTMYEEVKSKKADWVYYDESSMEAKDEVEFKHISKYLKPYEFYQDVKMPPVSPLDLGSWTA